MSRRLHTYIRLRRAFVSLPAAVIGLALLLLLMAVQVPAAGAVGRSVLVVAPHPDDDALIASGVVASALAAGDTVKVVYMTNGDMPDATYTNGHTKGLLREDEAVNAQAVLGVSESDLIFLGYPDGGLDIVFQNYPNSSSGYTGASGLSATYGDRGLGGSDYHYYMTSPHSHALYNRPNVVSDLDAILTAYHPTDIYTTSQFDAHRDHYTTYWFVQLALLRRMAAEPSYHPTLHQAIVWTSPDWGATWPLALNPQTALTAPPGLASTGLQWSAREDLPVPTDMQSTNPAVNRKIMAINDEMIEGGTSGFLGKFVHNDEVFWAAPMSMSVTFNGGAQYVANTNVTLNCAVSLDYSTMQMQFRNGTGTWSGWAPYAATSSWVLPSGDGLKTVNAEFQDVYGNVLDTSGTVTLDTVPPTVTGSADADTAWHNSDVTVALYPNDGGGSGIAATQYRPGTSGAWSPATGNQFTILAAGQNGSVTYQYRAVDNATNPSATHTLVLKFDTTKPTVTSSADTDTVWHRSDVTVTLSPADSGGSGVAKTQYKLHGSSTWLDAASNRFTVAGPADGSNNGAHVYDYQALDGAGNVSATGTCTVRIATAPNTSVASPLAGSANTGWITHAQTITLAASGGYGSVVTTYYTVDGVQHTYAGPFDVSSEGSHLVTYWSQDSVGYVEAHHTGYVNIDATAPTTSAVASPAGWTKRRVSVTLSAADGSGSGVATTYYKVGAGGQTKAYASPVAFTSQGVATVYFWSTDTAGNVGQAQTVQVMIDKTRPNTWARANVAVKRGKVATFSYRTTDNLSPDTQVTIKIFAGHKVVKSISVGWKAKGSGIFKWKCKLAKRTYTWKVYATDRAGNTQLIKNSKSLWVK